MASHSVTEAAKLAGVTRRTIYRHIKAGKLSASVTGGDNTVIETSELLRVYGALSQPEPGRYPLDHTKISLNMSHFYWLKCHNYENKLVR
jgi:excisionase family DNA binding protein